LSTSSPSYLLLGSLDRLQDERHQLDYIERWSSLAAHVEELWNTLEQQGVLVLQTWARRQGLAVDPARLTLLGPGMDILERVGAVGEVEKVTPGSCTFFLSPHQDLSRILQVTKEWPFESLERELETVPYPLLSTAMTVRETWATTGRWVPLDDARGAIVKEALTPYPPGIPVAVPGEVLTDEMVAWLHWWHRTVNAPIHGITVKEGRQWVWIVGL